MLKIEYSHTNYEDLLNHFAAVFKTKVKGNVLALPPAYGKGYMKLVILSNGLQAIISDYTVHQDILFQRNRISENFFTLRFDEVIVPEGVSENSQQSIAQGAGALRTAVYLGSAKFDWLFLANENTKVKGINIFFSKTWLEQFVGIETVGDLIKKYLNLKMSAFNYEPMDTEYKRILSEIINNSADDSLSNMMIQNG